jgi:hypothetical protein
MIEKL